MFEFFSKTPSPPRELHQNSTAAAASLSDLTDTSGARTTGWRPALQERASSLSQKLTSGSTGLCFFLRITSVEDNFWQAFHSFTLHLPMDLSRNFIISELIPQFTRAGACARASQAPWPCRELVLWEEAGGSFSSCRIRRNRPHWLRGV